MWEIPAKEIYPGEIEDWYNDSLEEEKEMFLGLEAFNSLLGFSLEFHELSKKSREKIKRLFEMWQYN